MRYTRTYLPSATLTQPCMCLLPFVTYQVETLAGAQLGYVPKEFTSMFPFETTFGRVHTAGRPAAATTDVIGVQVGCVSYVGS